VHGRERLAHVLVQRYQLDEKVVGTALSTRRRMRFRAGCDELTSIRLKSELEALGAMVSLVDTEPRLGALAGMPERMTLSALDGSDVTPAPEIISPSSPASAAAPRIAAPTPPPQQAPPPRMSAPQAAVAPPPREAFSGGRDVFAPPASDEHELELQVEQPRKRGTLAEPAASPTSPPHGDVTPRRPMSTAQPAVSRTMAAMSGERSRVEDAPPPPRPPRRDLARLIREPRANLAAGLALGLVAGFLPAHLYASYAEDKIDDIREELLRQPPPQSDGEYDVVVHQFTLAKERMVRVRNRIAVVTGAIWLLAGGAVTVGFWRLVPGDEET